jgi:hypothetical protein
MLSLDPWAVQQLAGIDSVGLDGAAPIVPCGHTRGEQY